MMNLASIIVLLIIAALLTAAFITARKSKKGKCNGNCDNCDFHCHK